MKRRPSATRLIWRRLGIFLVGAMICGAAADEGVPRSLADSPATGHFPLLTTARQLIDLPVSEAKKHYPVRFQGVVTYFDAHFKNLYVHDGTAGFWVTRDYRRTDFRTGQSIEIDGTSDAILGPVLRPRAIRLSGTNQLPTPRWTTFDRLASGKDDSDWLQVQGVVRTMAYRLGLLKIDLAVGADHVPLYVPGLARQGLPTNLIGAVIEARGICSMKMSTESQMDGFWFHVPSLEFIRVLRPSPVDPFALPTRSVHSLREWHRSEPDAQVKVGGVVTWSAGSRFFLRDETAPLEVRLQQPWVRDDPQGRYYDPPASPALAPGDRVEVTGYQSAGEFGHVLVDATCRRTGRSDLPTPARLTLPETLRPKADGELVTMEARLLESESRHAGKSVEQILVLQWGETIFEAALAGRSNALPVARGSLVRVTGVNSVEPDRWLKGRSFRLLLRNPQDVTVLTAPPRWTLHDAARVGLAAGVVMIGGFVWILVLRHRVATRTASLRETNDLLRREAAERQQAVAELHRAEAELRVALGQERELHELKSNFVNLVSHEFRTPLGVILSSAEILDDYGDTLTAAGRAEHLRDIKACSRYMTGLMEDVLVLGRVEAGKMQFRPIALDVPGFCRRIIDEALSATNRQCPIELTEENDGDPARGDESLLRHILQNLLSNAVKYSPPGRPVRFAVRRQNNDAIFTVRDEGIGIPAADHPRLFTAFHRGQNVGQCPGSGLGLVIVKRCVELHGGGIHIDSAEGQGTTVTVRLPLFVGEREQGQGAE